MNFHGFLCEKFTSNIVDDPFLYIHDGMVIDSFMNKLIVLSKYNHVLFGILHVLFV